MLALYGHGELFWHGGKLMKYYVFTYYDNVGGGRREILADSKKEASKRLRQFLNEYHPFRKYQIIFEGTITV